MDPYRIKEKIPRRKWQNHRKKSWSFECIFHQCSKSKHWIRNQKPNHHHHKSDWSLLVNRTTFAFCSPEKCVLMQGKALTFGAELQQAEGPFAAQRIWMGLWQALKYTDYQKTFSRLALASLRNTMTPQVFVSAFFEGKGETCLDTTKSKLKPINYKRSQ